MAGVAQHNEIFRMEPFLAAALIAQVVDVELLEVFKAILAVGMSLLCRLRYDPPVSGSQKLLVLHVAEGVLIEPVIQPDRPYDLQVFVV